MRSRKSIKFLQPQPSLDFPARLPCRVCVPCIAVQSTSAGHAYSSALRLHATPFLRARFDAAGLIGMSRARVASVTVLALVRYRCCSEMEAEFSQLRRCASLFASPPIGAETDSTICFLATTPAGLKSSCFRRMKSVWKFARTTLDVRQTGKMLTPLSFTMRRVFAGFWSSAVVELLQ